MSLDRMPGRFARSWCPSCRAPAGPDCPDTAKSPRTVRRMLARELHRMVHSG